MLRILAPTGLALILSFYLSGCSSEEKKLQAECAKPTGGAACYKLGLKRKGQEALQFFRAGCQKRDSDSCMKLAALTPDPTEAKRVLTEACDRQNAAACKKLGATPKAAEVPKTAEVPGKPDAVLPTLIRPNALPLQPGKGTPAITPTQSAPIAPYYTKPPSTYRPPAGPRAKPTEEEYYSPTAGRKLKKKKGIFRRAPNKK